MDDLSLRVYLENGSDAMRGGWLELPVVPERLDAFMRGVVGVDDGGGYAVVDHEPGWFGDVLGSDLESFSVSSLNLAARCVAHARDLAVADSVDGDVFLDMLATAAESEDVRFPSGIAALAARAGDVAEFWTEYSLPDSWRAGNSSPDELYGAHVAYGLMGDDAYSSLSYCMDLERLGRDEASNAGVTPGASGFVSDHEPLAPSGPVPDGRSTRWRRSPPGGGRRPRSTARSTSPTSCARARPWPTTRWRATGRIGALRSTSASWMMASTPDRTCSAWMCSPRWRTRCGASVRRVPAWAISTRSRAR